VICFSHLVQVAKTFDRFKAAKCGVVVISQGKPQVLAHFEKRNGFLFPVLGDPDRVAYKAFGLERVRWWTFLFPWVLWGYLVRILTGTLPKMPYQSEDVTQLGGDFLLDQTGKVLWSFRSADPSRRPSVDEMLKAVNAA
jgi:AhpC/TSA antioxidant enzyme